MNCYPCDPIRPQPGSQVGSAGRLPPDDLGALDADAFEASCAILWSKMGYRKTRRTSKTGDGGVDVVAISGKDGVLMQCKSSTVDGRELGWEVVKDVVAGAAGYAATYPEVRFNDLAWIEVG